MKVVLSLSGGMDSATLLGKLVKEGNQVKAVSFFYGSKHNKYELDAARKLASYFKIDHSQIDLSVIFSQIQSNLMVSGGDIPEGHYNDENMKKTVVPGRNHIFVAVLAGIAESAGYDCVAVAVHAGDHHIYPDCRPAFIQSLDLSIRLQSEQKVQVIAPFIGLDKARILEIGFEHGVPYDLTRTCYKDQVLSCGRCGSCAERLEAWLLVGRVDPVQYVKEV